MTLYLIAGRVDLLNEERQTFQSYLSNTAYPLSAELDNTALSIIIVLQNHKEHMSNTHSVAVEGVSAINLSKPEGEFGQTGQKQCIFTAFFFFLIYDDLLLLWQQWPMQI